MPRHFSSRASLRSSVGIAPGTRDDLASPGADLVAGSAGARERALSRPEPADRAARRRPRLAHDAGREDLADARPCRRHSSARRAQVRLVERGPARRRLRRIRHQLPAGDRHGRHLGHRSRAPDGRDHLHRGARQVPPGHARRPPRDVLRAHLLGAQRQHLPRSALGTRPGDLRRGSVPHRAHGGRLRHRHAGRRPEVLQGRLHAQALRRPQRAGAAAARLQRERLSPRSRRHLPSGVPRGGHRGPRAIGDVRLQRRRRLPCLRQPDAAAGPPARRLALRRLRRLRLRRGRRRRDRAQVRAGLRARLGRGRQGRHRPRMPVRPGTGLSRACRTRSSRAWSPRPSSTAP